MTLSMTARASDLKLIDRVIEAGLFGTQPVNVAASVRHESDRWTISNLKGTIGSSELSGKLTVDKSSGRTKLDGDVRFTTLDFVPRDIKSFGNVLKAVGRAIAGKQGPEASDADRAALSARVVGAG